MSTPLRDLVRAYIDFCEADSSLSGEGFCKEIVKQLAALYSLCIDCQLNTITRSERKIDPKLDYYHFIKPKLEAKLGKLDFYNELTNPFGADAEIVQMSLVDDWADVYRELKAADMLDSDQEFGNEVLVSFEIHWGAHVVNSLKAVYFGIFRK